MDADEYELMPHRAIEGMKKELEELRNHASKIEPKTGLPKETSTSIEGLTKSINSLMLLFKKASEEMKLEDRDDQLLGKQIKPLMEKIDMLLDQNRKIAKGIVAVADMIKEMPSPRKIEEQRPRPDSFRSQSNTSFSPGGMPPPQGMSYDMPEHLPPMGAPGSMPPPPGRMPPPPGMPRPPMGAPGPMPGLNEGPKKGRLGGLFNK